MSMSTVRAVLWALKSHRGHRRRHHRCQLRQVSWRWGRHRLQLLPLTSLNIGKWNEGDLMLLLEKLRLRVLRRRHMGKDFIGPAFHLRSCRCRRPATRQFIPGSRTPGQALIGLLSEDGHTDGTSYVVGGLAHARESTRICVSFLLVVVWSRLRWCPQSVAPCLISPTPPNRNQYLRARNLRPREEPWWHRVFSSCSAGNWCRPCELCRD